MKYWQCSVCKYIHQGDTPPEKCPVCGVDASKFVEIDAADVPQKTPSRPQPKKEAPAAASAPPKTGGKKAEPAAAVQKPPVKTSKALIEQVSLLLVKHHAHPISVHTPNGVLPAAVLLFIISWLWGTPMLEKAAAINLVIVILALPFVVYTGILEWKTKYNEARTSIFKLKILAASITCIACIISLVWYLINPDVLSAPNAWGFILINLIMVGAAGLAGHIGGKLVFKD